MRPYIVYIESKQSQGFQWIAFKSYEEADLFIKLVNNKYQSLRAHIIN